VTGNGAPQLGRLSRLIVKEQKEILRDRRTLLTLVVMPLFLYPLVGLVIQQFMSTVAAPRSPIYRIGFQVPDDAGFVGALLQMSDASARNAKQATAPEIQYDVQPDDELRRRLREGSLDVLIRVRKPYSIDAQHPVEVDLEFHMVRGRKLSEDAARYLRGKIDAASKQILANRLATLRVPQRPEPIRIEARSMEPPDRREGFPFASVAPFMLILMTITGAVYPAIDLTAGERERGTLEMLMAAPVPRMSILIAKYSAVLTVALLTALVNVAAMAATLYLTDVGRLIVGESGLSGRMIAQGFAALVLFVCFFAALLLALASFARSFKEAQAYLIPLMLVALAPGVISLFPGVELTPATAAAPLLNIVLFSRDLLQEGVDGWLTGIVLMANACYAAAALILAARLFGSEGVLYGGSGSWTGLVRRPATPRASVPTSTAVFLVGLIIPCFLLLTGLGRLAYPNNVVGQLLAGAVVLAVVFVTVPLVAVWSRNVPYERAFALVRPGIVSVVAALLLGATLWPFAIAVQQATKTPLWFADRPEILERLAALVEELRRIPLSARIVLLGIIPAVCEEIFFRGFLFGALIRRGVLFAVMTTTVLFAFFHVLSPSGLTPDRFAPSLVLGLFLGLLRWRSQSVWPGIVMHIAHNSVVSLAIEYPQRFGFTADAKGNLAIPSEVYLGAGVIAAVAVCLLLTVVRRSTDER
jgi:sodium transport system permease protein